ncbi:MAG: type IV pilin-like G/H family protein [Thermosynechococcaceae cyanobacterium]
MSHLLSKRLLLKAAVSLCGLGVVGCAWFGGSQTPDRSEQPSPSPIATASPGVSATGSPTSKKDGTTNTTPKSTNESEAKPAPPVKLSKNDQQIVSEAAQTTEKKGGIARQDVGKTYLSNILVQQQTERFVGGTFVPNLSSLSDKIPAEIAEYQFKILKADKNQAVVAAIAKVPGLNSYIGAAYNVEGSTPITSMCKSNLPAQAAPAAPKLVGGTIVCAPGSTATE